MSISDYILENFVSYYALCPPPGPMHSIFGGESETKNVAMASDGSCPKFVLPPKSNKRHF